ncbi:MAG: SOS response-associated peptidase family protein [Chromatiaceae bacterium]|nr:SOS response-associated peptidase family protein [Chromatiaceae bacterium]
MGGHLCLTTAAQGRVAPVHDRMSLILPPRSWATWLGCSRWAHSCRSVVREIRSSRAESLQRSRSCAIRSWMAGGPRRPSLTLYSTKTPWARTTNRARDRPASSERP